MFKAVCVFCGSKSGVDPVYATAAQEVGSGLARRGIEVVYGAGSGGLMGVVAQAALSAGGRVVGIIPDSLTSLEGVPDNLTELYIVKTMHERKALMAERSDAFIALPGGFGTLDELCEILTWAQLGFHSKPIGLLNVNGFYDLLLALFDQAQRTGFLRVEHRNLAQSHTDFSTLLSMMESASRQ